MLLTNAEIDSIWNGFSEDKRDGMTLTEFRRQVRAILNPETNAKMLDQMVEMRKKHTAAIMRKKQIDRALEKSRLGIE